MLDGGLVTVTSNEMDWPVNTDGCFVSSSAAPSIEADIDTAVRLLASWASSLSSVVAVYLRGSAATTTHGKRPFDVDLIIAVSGLHGAERSSLADEAQRKWAEYGRTALLPELDLLVIDSGRLATDPKRESLRLLVWLHGVRLAGAELFVDLPLVPANATTGLRLLRAQLESSRDGVDWYTSSEKDLPLEWLQKRALRLGGVISLAQGGPMSRHPARCAELIAIVAPQLASLSHTVCADLFTHCKDTDASIRGRALWSAISAVADDVLRQSGQVNGQ